MTSATPGAPTAAQPTTTSTSVCGPSTGGSGADQPQRAGRCPGQAVPYNRHHHETGVALARAPRRRWQQSKSDIAIVSENWTFGGTRSDSMLDPPTDADKGLTPTPPGDPMSLSLAIAANAIA